MEFLHHLLFREDASKVMIELLDSYTESTASQAQDDARKCIISSIADPKTFLLDHLLTLKPVKLLEGKKIYEVSGMDLILYCAIILRLRPNGQNRVICMGLYVV